VFHPLPVYVGLRYVRARSTRFFVSFITWASLIGVCVGVAVLIVILSVMNGFEGELRERLLSLSAQVRVTAARAAASGELVQPSPTDWQTAARLVQSTPGVAEVAPYAELQALAVRQPEMMPVLLRGIDPASAASVTELAHAITQGRLQDLTPGSGRVIVGAVIAERLGLAPGDALTVLVPTVMADGAPEPKLRELRVAGVFEVGLQDHDATLLFAPLADVLGLGSAGTAGEGLRVRLHDVFAAPAVAARLRARLPASLEVSDWTQDNANYFRAIRIEKTMMSLILLLIVAVAAFNIVAMLVMVVTDKRTDIAIMRTFGRGAAPRDGHFPHPGTRHRLAGRRARDNPGTDPRAARRHHRAVPRARVWLSHLRSGHIRLQCNSFRGPLVEHRSDRGRRAVTDGARHRLPGDPRRAHSARRSIAVRVADRELSTLQSPSPTC